MLNGMEFKTEGAAYLKALRPTAVLVNGTCRKLCDAVVILVVVEVAVVVVVVIVALVVVVIAYYISSTLYS